MINSATLAKSLIFLSILALSLGFNCTDAQNQQNCQQMDGCFWDSNNNPSACSGSFQPILCQAMNTTCIFLKEGQEAPGAQGNLESPFSFIDERVMNMIKKKNNTIIYSIDQQPIGSYSFSLKVLITSGQSLSILPYFANVYIQWDFKDFVYPMEVLEGVFIQSGGYVSWKNLIITHTGTNIIKMPFIYQMQPGQTSTTNFENLILKNLNSKYFDAMRSYVPLFWCSYIFPNNDLVTGKLRYMNWRNITVQNVNFPMATNYDDVFDIDQVVFKDCWTQHLSELTWHFASRSLKFSNIYVTNVSMPDSLFLFYATSEQPPQQLSFKNVLTEWSYASLYNSIGQQNITIENQVARYVDTSLKSKGIIIIIQGGGNQVTTVKMKNITYEHLNLRESAHWVISATLQIEDFVMRNITVAHTELSETIDFFQGMDQRGSCTTARADSSIIMKRATFESIHQHCILIEDSKILLDDSLFTNEKLEEKIPLDLSLDQPYPPSQGVSWILMQGGKKKIPGITMNNNTFKYNRFPPAYGGGLRKFGLFQRMFFSRNTFEGLIAQYGGGFAWDGDSRFYFMDDSNFRHNRALKDGGALYATSSTASGLSSGIMNTNFYNNSAAGKGGALFLNNIPVSLGQMFISSNTGRYGGAIFISNFQKIIGSEQGYEGYKDLYFIDNYATQYGGCIHAFFNVTKLTSFVNVSCDTSLNFAGKQDPGFSFVSPSYYRIQFFRQKIIDKNEKTQLQYNDIISNQEESELVFEYTSPTHRFELDGNYTLPWKSGHTFPYIISLTILDANQTVLKEIRNEQFQASAELLKTIYSPSSSSNAEDSKIILLQKSELVMNDGQLIDKENSIEIRGKAGMNATITLELRSDISPIGSFLDQFVEPPLINIPITLKKCDLGDIFISISDTCSTCQAGQYSLDSPYDAKASCKQCPANAKCLGGDMIAPNYGYWRFSQNSDKVLKCPEEEACLGGFDEETRKYTDTGKCKFPYEGQVCSTCVEGWAKFGASSRCTNCAEDTGYYILFTFLLLLQCAFILYYYIRTKFKLKQIKTQTMSDDMLSSKEFSSTSIKITFNYIQVLGVIFSYEINWPGYMGFFLSVQSKIVPATRDGFAIECILVQLGDDSSDIRFHAFLGIILQPIAFFALFSIFNVSKYFQAEKQSQTNEIASHSIESTPQPKSRHLEELNDSILLSLILIGYLLQINVIMESLQIFDCRNSNTDADPKLYWSRDYEVECWSPRHKVWAFGIGMPMIILWGFLLPAVLFRYIWKKHKELKHHHKNALKGKYLFLVQGLKPDYWYWDFVIFIKKYLLVIIKVFFVTASTEGQLLASILLLMFFLVIQLHIKPYISYKQKDSLNRLEIISLIATISIAAGGCYFLTHNELGDKFVILFAIVTFGLCGYFFIYWLRHFFALMFERFKGQIRTLKRLSFRRNTRTNISTRNVNLTPNNVNTEGSVHEFQHDHCLDTENAHTQQNFKDDVEDGNNSIRFQTEGELIQDSPTPMKFMDGKIQHIEKPTAKHAMKIIDIEFMKDGGKCSDEELNIRRHKLFIKGKVDTSSYISEENKKLKDNKNQSPDDLTSRQKANDIEFDAEILGLPDNSSADSQNKIEEVQEAKQEENKIQKSSVADIVNFSSLEDFCNGDSELSEE